MLKKILKSHFDPFATADQVFSHLPGIAQTETVRKRIMDIMLVFGIPFNRWLGMKIVHLDSEKVVIESPPTTLRQNHVGTAHACAQALMGEYAAGLVVAQHFAFDQYRMIIGRLDIEYFKAGVGVLRATAAAPAQWPKLESGDGWVDMETRIENAEGKLVALCRTRWQVKAWERVESDRRARDATKS